MKEYIDRLASRQFLNRKEWRNLLAPWADRQGRVTGQSFSVSESAGDAARYAAALACRIRDQIYGKNVYIRGLIEFTNYCKNDCYYCGIRRSNKEAARYRLTREEILGCCENGYKLGFRTFVLQGGEDGYFTDDRLEELIRSIKQSWPDCAVTLSVGERDRESYARLKETGADRYLLRHETANHCHYRRLHPPELSASNRKNCLFQLKQLGYQTGAGLMVGSPGQTVETLTDDMEFLQELQPEMVGIGPFLPHSHTPFGGEPAGSTALTLYLLSLVRIMLPSVLLPATTALATASAGGREAGILAGANVVMPNLSPENVREKYLLYNNKICTGKEAAQNLEELKAAMDAIGYRVVSCRGDHKRR